MMEAVLVLSALCRAVTLRVPTGEQPPQTAALITLRPQAARLQITPREAGGSEKAAQNASDAVSVAR